MLSPCYFYFYGKTYPIKVIIAWEAEMIISRNEVAIVERENIRGGKGKARLYQYLTEGGQHNVKFVSEVEMQPLAVIGEHLHETDEEFYLVLWGEGTGVLDGRTFAIQKGDAFVCKMGHTHGITAGNEGLSFLAILT
jgi:mannose-6-phosphate isomerase-like protein (cupin superfamily)